MEMVLKNSVFKPERLRQHGRYWKMLDAPLDAHLQTYLPVFEQFRCDAGLVVSQAQWNALPMGSGDPSWHWRRQSQSLLREIVGERNFQSTLEIGAWNGWLTKYLARKSASVIAADYFTHPLDGIGNIAALADTITALQCDLEQIPVDFKPGSFDLIVINHCLSYTKNPAGFVQNLTSLLRPGGLLVCIGITFYKDPQKKMQQNADFAQRFYRRYHLGVFIQPVKGYMDAQDIAQLRQAGCSVMPYRQKKLQNLMTRWLPRRPYYVALLFKK